jgi:hypothetical protein
VTTYESKVLGLYRLMASDYLITAGAGGR